MKDGSLLVIAAVEVGFAVALIVQMILMQKLYDAITRRGERNVSSPATPPPAQEREQPRRKQATWRDVTELEGYDECVVGKPTAAEVTLLKWGARSEKLILSLDQFERLIAAKTAELNGEEPALGPFLRRKP